MMRTILPLVLTSLVGSLAWGQNVQRVRLEHRSFSGDLKATVEGILATDAGPLWIAYQVPLNQPEMTMCCGDWDQRGTCALERDRGTYSTRSREDGLPISESNTMIVLLRGESGRISRLRVVTPDCRLDAGGLAMIVLDGPSAGQSVAFLKGLVDDADLKHRGSSALMAIAHHEGEAADEALQGFLEESHSRKVRKEAVFWIGVARGERALPVLRSILRNEKSNLRKEAIFAVQQNDSKEGDRLLIETARRDPSGSIRQEALFWLSQRASREAVAAIREAADNDPDTEVKVKAVFALSQLPPEEGIPHLIRLARTNANKKVREQAIFWLGQSGDPRALDFFEEILSAKGGH